jgi:hypothetical protein
MPTRDRKKSRSLVLSPEAAFVEAMEGRRKLRDTLAQIDGHHGTTSACRRDKRRSQVSTLRRRSTLKAVLGIIRDHCTQTRVE